jgi:hypothetical protein
VTRLQRRRRVFKILLLAMGQIDQNPLHRAPLPAASLPTRGFADIHTYGSRQNKTDTTFAPQKNSNLPESLEGQPLRAHELERLRTFRDLCHLYVTYVPLYID